MSSNSTPIECNITSQETSEESKDFLVPTSQFNKRVNDLQKLMEPEFKRKSKIVEKFGRDMSPESYRKEMSKFYSQQNRRRKKGITLIYFLAFFALLIPTFSESQLSRFNRYNLIIQNT